ncbi:glutathione S-transferase N-terminal domain-containing protein [Collinsella sp. zg1085]|uniref:glutaredoxin family protein n=1 Tax=Collinsella sp. zg1085 TaxID=2844380 RepID=UPI001C0E025B|nr:glutathione S-transferase N-terminal domain-containing protein [Collinsella sp. zg1085]QWT17952.1 glutathione S-transferase N-terminal domain-containing protein [Collinsella sp. zg1085]
MATSYELYYKPTCPWCQKVLGVMDELGIELPLKDIVADPANAEKLIEVGGKRQVPCLFIDGKPLYESGDIIAYLKQQFA